MPLIPQRARWILALLFAGAALGQGSGSTEEHLQQELKGHTFIIRNFYTNSTLEYDLNGALQSKPEGPVWQDAGVRIDDVKLDRDKLELKGTRVSSPQPADAQTRQSPRDRDIKIQIMFGDIAPDESKLDEVIHKVFLTKNDGIAGLERSADVERVESLPLASPDSLFQPHSVTAPVVLNAPDPDYSEEARRKKIEGTVLLWILVGEDGRVHDAQITRSLGSGLDQEAIKAVRRWTFKPATKNGAPVETKMNVQVSFHLYH